jgi:glycosyltransferase involved in cell wall biosynthesis
MLVLIEDLSELAVRYVPVAEEPSPTGFSLKVASELFRGRYDLVHSHGFTSGVCAVLSAVASRTPHLMTSHDVINENQFVGGTGKVKKQVIGQLFNLIDAIQSVSREAQLNLLEHFPALGRRDGKCIVIPNGIEIDRFVSAIPRDLRGEVGEGRDVFLIGFLGRFMAQKGFRYLVDAIELLRARDDLVKQPLVLTFGEGAFIREEKKAVKERDLADSFRFLPFTSNVAGTIKGLDVVVIPSLWEACPLLPMEALVAGVPVIGSDCIGLREVLRGTPAILVPQADATALAQALAQEMEKSSRESFLSFRATAAERFDVRKTTRSILNLYERMTASTS